MTRTLTRWTLITLTLLLAGTTAVYAHCQVPCGIYGDENRFESMMEDVTTIEKSMNQINELSGQNKPNYNQLVRWVENKEVHADKLTETVTYYFMAQRVKPADMGDEAAYKKYVTQITQLHQIMVHAMKAKQTTDLAHVKHLRELIEAFKKSYHGH